MNSTAKTRPIYFNPQKLGASLKEVGNDYLKVKSREVETRWFRDVSGEIDVFIWLSKDKKIIKQQVSIMGQLVEWNLIEGIKTGVTMENEILNPAEEDPKERVEDQSASETIFFDKAIQFQAVNMAMDLVKNMECLEGDLKTRILHAFEQKLPNIVVVKPFSFIHRQIRRLLKR